MSIKSIAVFCGSKSGNNILFEEHTKQLGEILAKKNVSIIYGGGRKGLMGAIADGALAEKALSLALCPKY